MNDVAQLVLFVAVYLVLARYVLPKLGIGT